jgi:hypothetical protein
MLIGLFEEESAEILLWQLKLIKHNIAIAVKFPEER